MHALFYVSQNDAKGTKDDDAKHDKMKGKMKEAEKTAKRGNWTCFRGSEPLSKGQS